MICGFQDCSYDGFSGQGGLCYWHWKIGSDLIDPPEDEDRPLSNPADIVERLEVGALIRRLERA